MKDAAIEDSAPAATSRGRRGPERSKPRVETPLIRYLDRLDSDAREALAQRAGTTVEYLFQLKGGHRVPSVDMSKRLVAAANGGLSLADCRPDVWGRPRA